MLPEPVRDTELAALIDQATRIAEQARTLNTRRAYTADWAHFTAWCEVRNLPALPATPATIILYLTALAPHRKTSTLDRRAAAISQAHQAAGLESPSHRSAVRLFLRALRRDKSAQGDFQRGKRALPAAEFQAMLAAIPADTVLGLRDRALLLVGFLGAFRRSELVALDREHVEIAPAGLTLHLRRSKTDPEGQGTRKGLPAAAPGDRHCPVAALRAWLTASEIETGPLFRPVTPSGAIAATRLSDRAVARAVKRYAIAVGLDPAPLAGHSLRAGFATAAARAGKSERAIMNQTGHRSVQMVRRYIRDGSLFRDNAAEGLLGPPPPTK